MIQPLPLSPLPPDDQPAKGRRREQFRRRATRFYFLDNLRKPTRTQLEEAAAHQHHDGAPVAAADPDGNGDHQVGTIRTPIDG